MSDKKISPKQMIRNSSLALLGTASGLGVSKNKKNRKKLTEKNRELPFRISMNNSTLKNVSDCAHNAIASGQQSAIWFLLLIKNKDILNVIL